MGAESDVRIEARSADGLQRAFLRITLLPQGSVTSGPAPLVLASGEPAKDDVLASVQLLEGHEYLYAWDTLPLGVSHVTTDPQEAFQPDTKDGLKGRLRPGLATGLLAVRLRSGEADVAQLDLEVRSRKLSYLTEYRWMLRDIADKMTELIMERFAASGTTFAPRADADAVTLYQRFAFLRSLLTSEAFQNALNEITRKPHVAWEDEHETVRPGQSIKANSYTLRQLAGPGRRVTWLDGPIKSIPNRLDRRRTEATQNTTPNRFVLFALQRWRQVIADIDRSLASVGQSAAVVRGRREVEAVLEMLDELLTRDLFKEVGPLTHFPADNQVLQRREGYRDVFRAYLEFELAAQLSWRGAESSYSAGQRDVATLYEYWAFLQLARLVADLAGENFDLKPLVHLGADGLNVALQQGKETVLKGELERYGRRLAIELCFNRTFSATLGVAGSWTRPMRPDYSLIIHAARGEPASFEPVVVHFDAKYRVNFKEELFGADGELADDPDLENVRPESRKQGALRSDLLKMHAYRDAIRRSAGAYVIYPGDDDRTSGEQYKEFHELLPGLGAFALRPSEHGDAIGESSLRKFLNDVFEHVATRLTQHERGRYWLEEVYGRYDVRDGEFYLNETDGPAPETRVLLGYVKSAQHWKWIRRTKSYNVRTSGRAGGVSSNAALLYSQLLLLYCPDTKALALARVVSDPELVEQGAMEGTGYPNPTGNYWCIQIAWLAGSRLLSGISSASIANVVERRGRIKGEPLALSWAELNAVSVRKLDS